MNEAARAHATAATAYQGEMLAENQLLVPTAATTQVGGVSASSSSNALAVESPLQWDDLECFSGCFGGYLERVCL
jgi:hypothetical protein